MVFLIKKNAKGDRSVSLRTNSLENDLNGLLEAMRGLTFKIEIKITDIVREAPVADKAEAPHHEKAELAVPKAQEKLETSIQEKVKTPAQESIKAPQAERNESPRFSRENITPPLMRSESSLQDNAKKLTTPLPPERAIKPILENKETMKVAQEKVEVKASNGTKPSTPKYPQGTVTVGSTVETCCIAVDDRSSPIFGYITFDDDQLVKTFNIINTNVEKIQNSPLVTSVKVGDIALAKSCEDNQWYRSVIEKVTPSTVDVFFFDWGLRETIAIDRIRTLSDPDLMLSKIPACAVKLKFNARSPEIVEDFLRCDTAFKLRIDTFDEATEAYEVTVSRV